MFLSLSTPVLLYVENREYRFSIKQSNFQSISELCPLVDDVIESNSRN